VSVATNQIRVAAYLYSTIETFNAMMEKKSDGQRKEEHGKGGNANGLPEGKQVTAPPDAPSDYEYDKRKENSTQPEVFVHEEPRYMSTNLPHPVRVWLVLTLWCVVLTKHQPLIVCPIEQEGNASQQSKYAEKHREDSKDFLNAWVANEVDEAGPFAGSIRLCFTLIVGRYFGSFRFFDMFTGVSGHCAIQLIGIRLRKDAERLVPNLFRTSSSPWQYSRAFQHVGVWLGQVRVDLK
jgi:hypothetical protein